jgi:hypothetical protein
MIGAAVTFANSLHRDRTAALAPLYGFILLFFAWGMAATLNTGEVAYDKIRSQNAADAIALAHAEQAARDLNVMSMNNMALTQMLVVSAVTFTLSETLLDIERRGVEGLAKVLRSARRCGPNGWCWALHAFIAGQIATAMADAGLIALRYRPDKGFVTSQKLIGALNRMNDYLVNSFPRRSGELITLLLDENRIDAAYTYPPCQTGGKSQCRGKIGEGGDLPVERTALSAAAAHTELCTGAERGSDGRYRTDFLDHGYPRNKGPYTAGGSSSNPHLRDHVNRQTGLSWLLPFFGEYTLRLWDPLIRFGSTKYSQKQTSKQNDFTRRMDRNWSLVCGTGGSVFAAGAGFIFNLPQTYWLKGRPTAAALSPILGTLGFDTEKLSYLTITAKLRGERFNPKEFGERQDPYHAYAQAMVYNPVSFDLYTSKWKARLVPSSLMDQPQPVVQALQTRSGNGLFDLLPRIVQAARGSNQWSLVNAH